MGGSRKFFALQILLIAIALILASQAQAAICENEQAELDNLNAQLYSLQDGHSANESYLRSQADQALQRLTLCQQQMTQGGQPPPKSNDPNEQALARCERDANETISQCSTDVNNPMLSQAAGEADQFSNSMSEDKSKGTTNQALDTCQKTNNTIGSNKEAMGNVKMMCQATYETCQQSCKKATDALKNITNTQLKKRLTAANSTCSSAQAKLGAIDQNIAGISGAQQRSQNCANDVTGGKGDEKKDDGKGSDSNADKAKTASEQQAINCQLNPTANGCAKLAETCSNPGFASTNATCQCFLYNQCSTKNSASADSPSTPSGSVGSTGSADYGSGGGSVGTDGNSGSKSSPFASQWGNPAAAGGGSGGGSGGNRTGANQADHIGPEESEKTLNTNILNGSRGGGGGGGFAASQIGPRGGSYSPTGNWIPPKMNKKDEVDLSKFRPIMKGRQPASALQPNGLLPSNADLFFQITRRYLILGDTLKP